MFSPACCATSTNWTPDGVGFDAAASTTSGFFHFQSGVVSASVSALPNTKREDPRKRRRGKLIDGDNYSERFPFISLRIIQAMRAILLLCLEGFVCEVERQLKQLLPASYRHGCIADWRCCRS